MRIFPNAVVTKTYSALKKEEIVSMRIFAHFSFLELRNNRWTYSKYFQNNIYEIDISSACQ